MTIASLYRNPVPMKIDGTAYVYVIEFSNGTVKVGRSSMPEFRIQQHQRDARAFGFDLSRVWLSEAHADAKATELALIRECSAMAGITSGARREYFNGSLVFGFAVSAAQMLALEYSAVPA